MVLDDLASRIQSWLQHCPEDKHGKGRVKKCVKNKCIYHEKVCGEDNDCLKGKKLWCLKKNDIQSYQQYFVITLFKIFEFGSIRIADYQNKILWA